MSNDEPRPIPIVTVQNELGANGVQLAVDENTEFFFRTPWDAVS